MTTVSSKRRIPRGFEPWSVTWDYQARSEAQDTDAAPAQRFGVRRKGVMGRTGGSPPRMGENDQPVLSRRECRDVLVRVAWDSDQADIR